MKLLMAAYFTWNKKPSFGIFETFYLPGITNPASDANWRHPIGLPELPEDKEQVIATAICRETRAHMNSISVEYDPLDKDVVICYPQKCRNTAKFVLECHNW